MSHTFSEEAQPRPDLQLAPDALPGDLVRIVRDHHALLYRYAYRLAGSGPDAEDLVQQTFLIAQQKLHQLRDEQRELAWLCTVLRRCYLRSVRRRRPVPAATLDLDLSTVVQEVRKVDEIDEEALQKAIATLPEDYKVVVLMFYFEMKSYKEIAADLGIPLGTVMSRLSRAKRSLRHLLAASDPPLVMSMVASPAAERCVSPAAQSGSGSDEVNHAR